jgi:hypothetical protein
MLKRNTGKNINTQSSFTSSDFSDKIKESEHKCKVFGPLKEGEVTYLDPSQRFKEFPAQVDNLIGR